MLMTVKGAQRCFVSSAKELFNRYQSDNNITKAYGCTLEQKGEAFVISNPRFTVNVSAKGKFSTSTRV